jgi:primosomal protein N' (replication factor Y)
MGLLCHYCDWRGPVPEKCPSCKDGEVKQLGLGTERVEEELRAKFPKARVARMDLDTTRKAGSLEGILGKFRRGEIDLLVGTQMIAKGHDFPGVTLVGVIGADVGLALPDFRASERVFQLMVQVSGRAGRAEKEGTIYLQTFHPEHPALQAAVKHDTASFWDSELELRKTLGYPPYSRLGLLVFRHPEEGRALAAAEKAAEFLSREGRRLGVAALGPAPCAIFKLRGQYRFQVLLKCPKPGPLRELVRALDARVETPTGVVRVVDLDPQNML